VPTVLEVALHLLELRLVLDRAHLRALLQPIADDRLPRQPAQLVADGIIDRIVDIEPLDGHAPLAGVEHGTGKDLRCHFLRVGVVEHNRRIVAAELQGQALQRASGAGHDLLARRGRAGEGDLGHVGVAGEGSSEVVLIDDDIDDARRKNPGTKFAEPERCQRRGRGRLGHDRVSGEEGRRHLDR
jgi:hypothetical protein